MTALEGSSPVPPPNEIPMDRKYVIIAHSEEAIWGGQALSPPSSFITPPDIRNSQSQYWSPGKMELPLFRLFKANPGLFMFPDRIKYLCNIIPYFFTSGIDFQCVFEGGQSILVFPELM